MDWFGARNAHHIANNATLKFIEHPRAQLNKGLMSWTFNVNGKGFQFWRVIRRMNFRIHEEETIGVGIDGFAFKTNASLNEMLHEEPRRQVHIRLIGQDMVIFAGFSGMEKFCALAKIEPINRGATEAFQFQRLSNGLRGRPFFIMSNEKYNRWAGYSPVKTPAV